MQEIKEGCYKGTRILLGETKRDLLSLCVEYVSNLGFSEISIPIIQPASVFSGKVGEENNNLMFKFTDNGNRDICLAPEYTAVIQNLAKTTFKQAKNLKLFYVQECFRGEKPQRGRYRQFTQFGIEILNPTGLNIDYLGDIALTLLSKCGLKDIGIDYDVVRGLDYYKDGRGFEIRYKDSQLVGGGEYDGGVGFALGIDRLLNLIQ